MLVSTRIWGYRLHQPFKMKRTCRWGLFDTDMIKAQRSQKRLSNVLCLPCCRQPVQQQYEIHPDRTKLKTGSYLQVHMIRHTRYGHQTRLLKATAIQSNQNVDNLATYSVWNCHATITPLCHSNRLYRIGNFCSNGNCNQSEASLHPMWGE